MRVVVIGRGGREHAIAWACEEHGHTVSLADDLGELTADDVKWIVLLVLLNQPGQENAFALMEELVYNGEPLYLH